MPITECTLPDGGKGYRWGDHGKCFANRADAEKQAAAAHANGFVGDSASRLAFDRASVRRIDQDGRLHVEVSNLSKATVNPYLGEEISNSEALGLDPKRIYHLLRDPEELEKAASSFNNIPLIDAFEQTGKEHIPVFADDPRKEIVVGSTGTDAVFKAPYLQNSLVVWDAKTIAGIESDERKEISCAYHYRADMTPGTFEGTPYDGVMRDLRGNHVAIVNVGRAGPDVVVGDSQPLEIEHMKKPLSRRAVLAKGALVALKPKLAADAKLDMNALVAGITAANWQAKKAGLIAAIKPKLAADADIGDIAELLDALDGDKADDDVAVDEDPKPIDPKPAEDADPIDEVMAMLKGKLSDEDCAAVEQKLRSLNIAGDDDVDPPAMDNPPPTPGTPAPPATSNEKKDGVSKPAMDAAIKAAVKIAEDAAIKRVLAITEAEAIVHPYVGKLAIAADSAEGVFKAALDVLGVSVEGVHPSAYRAVLQAQKKPGEVQSVPRIAGDARPQGFIERFPNAQIRKI